MKVFAVLVLLFGVLLPVRADTWTVTATCDAAVSSDFGESCTDPGVINATFTTQLETGIFFDTEFLVTFTGTEPVVTDIVGTFDGLAMTLVPSPESWFENGGIPEGVGFTAGGMEYVLDFNAPVVLHQFGPNFSNFEVLDWSATDPAAIPEPRTIWLLFAGLLLLLLYRKHNRSSFSVHR